jgi:hypothetical protein
MGATRGGLYSGHPLEWFSTFLTTLWPMPGKGHLQRLNEFGKSLEFSDQGVAHIYSSQGRAIPSRQRFRMKNRQPGNELQNWPANTSRELPSATRSPTAGLHRIPISEGASFAWGVPIQQEKLRPHRRFMKGGRSKRPLPTRSLFSQRPNKSIARMPLCAILNTPITTLRCETPRRGRSKTLNNNRLIR